jgi:peptide/nickel transport system ATP-binding protein
MSSNILEVRDLRVYYHVPAGVIKAVDRITFSLTPSERFGLVGESGSGKTTAAMGFLRLIKEPGRIEGGQVLLEGEDLLKLSESDMRRRRLSKIALIPQASMNALNPVVPIRMQLLDGILDHNGHLTRQQLDARVDHILDQVGLSPKVASMYPHQLSGGMKQRVCIAIGFSLSPQVIIADEPTSALDVVVQMQVMETLRRAQEQTGTAIILVGHDMGLMAQFVQRMGVMYAGRLMEIGPVRDMFSAPLHPYTRMLMESVPTLSEKRALVSIPGMTPSLLDPPPGCLFGPRCPNFSPDCAAKDPELIEVRPNRWTACSCEVGRLMDQDFTKLNVKGPAYS